jgi:DNA-binding PadR family transcriptional regulator
MPWVAVALVVWYLIGLVLRRRGVEFIVIELLSRSSEMSSESIRQELKKRGHRFWVIGFYHLMTRLEERETVDWNMRTAPVRGVGRKMRFYYLRQTSM